MSSFLSVLCSFVRSVNRSIDHSQAVLLVLFFFVCRSYARLFFLCSFVFSVDRSIDQPQVVLLLQFLFICLLYVRLSVLLTVPRGGGASIAIPLRWSVLSSFVRSVGHSQAVLLMQVLFVCLFYLCLLVL